MQATADSMGCLIGVDQLDPLGEGEPPGPGPGPGPGRGVHQPKRSAARMVDRIGQVGMAWSERMGPDPGTEVPDQRPGTWTQHAADLGQAGRRVGPVVHRQGADHQVEGSVGECQGGHVAEDKRWPALVAVPRAVGVGSGASDHGWVQVQAGHVEPVLAGQPDRQVPGVRSRPPGPVRRRGWPPRRRPRCAGRAGRAGAGSGCRRRRHGR